VSACPTCASPVPPGARFCPTCGTELAARRPTGEERKVVSVLFADLVGFTARADGADPEDVRAALRTYHARLRRELERYGGTVEKLIGDAVMAVFGAPVAREDDAERAVRAALRAQEAVAELAHEAPDGDLVARAAVASGEAVVTLGARPDLGEAMVAGDVVNTAARLQTLAPPGGVVVDEATHRATRGRISYEPLAPVAARGKQAPVAVWRAVSARSHHGVDLAAEGRAALVGRTEELALLTGVFARSLAGGTVQLVTVVGEPGVGKSRLVAELRAHADARPELVGWRQGRCLSYGDDVAFWALGEIVKAEAGILESDDPARAADRLAAAVEAAADDPAEREWLRARLAPLVGLGADGADAGRGESFAAWTRFLEDVAARRPLVTVVEDLHWADPAMVHFVDHLVSRAGGVPLVVVCTARPELYDRHPGWGGGKRNSTTIALDPLQAQETAELVEALTADVPLPPATRAALVERSGGNPLFAEEFARMAAERGLGELALPETVQAVIAARLDTLPPHLKGVLQDAAVVGKVFWAGAVAAIGGRDRPAVDEALLDLAAREFVRPARSSSVHGQTEHAFWHSLVRDVAYGQIPRAARAAKHRAAAAWIEAIAGERVHDHAGFLAHHYCEALALTEAAGAPDTDGELRATAARFTLMAGDRVMSLDPGAAAAHYERGLDLISGDAERGSALARLGSALRDSGDMPGAQGRLEQAVALLRPAGDRQTLAEALADLSGVLRVRGETAVLRRVLAEAEALAAELPGGRAAARVESDLAGNAMLSGEWEESVRRAERAIRLARDAGAQDVGARSLQFLGIGRFSMGDAAGGIADLREALAEALRLGLGRETVLAYVNLADLVWLEEGPAAGLEHKRAAIDLAERRGIFAQHAWATAESTWMLLDLGDLDGVEAAAATVLEWERDQGGVTQPGTIARTHVAWTRLWRGRLDEADEIMAVALPAARRAADRQVLVMALGVGAQLAGHRGDHRAACGLAAELLDGTVHPSLVPVLPAVVRTLVGASAPDLAADLVAVCPNTFARGRLDRQAAEAILLEARGGDAAAEHARAADGLAACGAVPEAAMVRMAEGRCLLRAGRTAEGRRRLAEARDALAALGAEHLAAEAEVSLTTGARRPRART
jgi:class 3 adenylate cyclase/tetratricopeptide (TPR) repeat protein